MKMLVNGVIVTGETPVAYTDNPKRVGSAAYDRYEAYQTAQTVGEYFELAESKHAKADLRWDHDKGFVELDVD